VKRLGDGSDKLSGDRPLLQLKALDEGEIEILGDAAAGDPDASIATYRLNSGEQLHRWRAPPS
jgi:hypothetical protein